MKIFLLIYGIFFLTGAGFIIAGINADPFALTGDGYNLKRFFYFMGGFFALFPLLLGGIALWLIMRAGRKRAFLKAHGIRGTAVILGAERTGVEINNIPVLRFRLQVRTETGETFEATHRERYDGLLAGPVPIGKTLPVYIHPENRKKLLLDWEAGASASPGF